MIQIRPCADLRNNYNEISKICHETNQPIYITKNGYNDLVILSNEAFEKYEEEIINKLITEHFDKEYSSFDNFKKELYKKIDQALKDIQNGNYQPMEEALPELEAKYGLSH